jgi:ABC-type sugar transport system ATPase subunit
MESLFEFRDVYKEFPGVRAVDNVSLTIRKGEIHIIIGENGAGKSTLVKMAAGIYSVDRGEMIFEGKPFSPVNVVDAQNAGIHMIHQELSLMPNRTVAENVFIGREPLNKWKLVDQKAMNRLCKKFLDELEIDIDPCAKIKELSIAQQQMVEIARAISADNKKLLIMDEPTSSLTQKEIDKLFGITRRLKAEGMSIIYISHRMQELMDIGDRVTVMRDGAYVGTRDAATLEMQELISMMVGRKIENIYNRTQQKAGAEILRTQQLTGLRFRNANICVHSGEIVGFAGLVGAGRTELVKAIFGYEPIVDGEIFMEGKPVQKKGYNCRHAINHKISLLPENRKMEGLFINLSIKDNIVQSSLHEMFPRGIVHDSKICQEANNGVKNLKIATTSIHKSVCELSGGNQQKVVVAKWLVTESKLIIFDEPTRGIDIGAKAEIYSIMDDLAVKGAAIIMISSDLPELLGLADRIYVMKDGDIVGEVARTDSQAFTQEHILKLAIEGAGT